MTVGGNVASASFAKWDLKMLMLLTAMAEGRSDCANPACIYSQESLKDQISQRYLQSFGAWPRSRCTLPNVQRRSVASQPPQHREKTATARARNKIIKASMAAKKQTSMHRPVRNPMKSYCCLSREAGSIHESTRRRQESSSNLP